MRIGVRPAPARPGGTRKPPQLLLQRRILIRGYLIIVKDDTCLFAPCRGMERGQNRQRARLIARLLRCHHGRLPGRRLSGCRHGRLLGRHPSRDHPWNRSDHRPRG
jgi:hypothetical protein